MKKIIFVVVILLILCSGILGLTKNVSNVYIGIHNIDLSYNMCNLENQGLKISDLNSAGFNWDKDKMYSEGLKQIKNGILGIILNIFFIFCSIVITLEDKK